MRAPPAVVWLREGALRLDDNPVLEAAVQTGLPLLPVFILDDTPNPWTPGAAARWWLYESLLSLGRSLKSRGSRLILRRGTTREELEKIVQETGASHLFYNFSFEPWLAERDSEALSRLKAMGVHARGLNASLLFEPSRIRTGQGGPFRIFTPFYKACRAAPAPSEPLPAPRSLNPPESWPHSHPPETLELTPKVRWDEKLARHWTPGEGGAATRWRAVHDTILHRYADERDRPDIDATSRLSPHLRFGEISVRRLWHEGGGISEKFAAELCWREFNAHLLITYPDLAEKPIQEKFSAFPWREDPAALAAWQEGRTGYPIVDAGMRQLWETGWMHNRVRMIAASFLVKNLLIPWQAGEKWFRDTLVDADPASNPGNWQWVAGCGADAAPFFRIFNPLSQSFKFDPEGNYLRLWVPELISLPAPAIHAPWETPSGLLQASGVIPGKTYPLPLVNHAFARNRALAAFETLKNARQERIS